MPAPSAQWWWPTADAMTTRICCWTTRLSLRLEGRKGSSSTTTSPSSLTWEPLAVRMKMRKWRATSSRGKRGVTASPLAAFLSPPSQAWSMLCRWGSCKTHSLIIFFEIILLFIPPLYCAFSVKSRQKVGIRELEIETQVAQMMGRAHTKAPDSSLFEPGEGEDKTYLLFTTGSLTYSPHQIGKFPKHADLSKKDKWNYTQWSQLSPLMWLSLSVSRY